MEKNGNGVKARKGSWNGEGVEGGRRMKGREGDY
jgi:hypothetical protein